MLRSHYVSPQRPNLVAVLCLSSSTTMQVANYESDPS